MLTPPDDVETLKRFYYQVRPWGFWRPIHNLVQAEHPEIVANRDFRRDMFNVAIGITWQIGLTATGIYIVLRDFESLAWTIGVVLVTSSILKRNWYDKLVDYPPDIRVTYSN
jgi:solute:Na+ symporter, SSS family